MRPTVARLAALLLALLAACVTAGQERSGVCPEYRSLRCATTLRCAPDGTRGCLACACAAWDGSGTGPAGATPEGDPRAPAPPPMR